jgi:hypothetical protein
VLPTEQGSRHPTRCTLYTHKRSIILHQRTFDWIDFMETYLLGSKPAATGCVQPILQSPRCPRCQSCSLNKHRWQVALQQWTRGDEAPHKAQEKALLDRSRSVSARECRIACATATASTPLKEQAIHMPYKDDMSKRYKVYSKLTANEQSLQGAGRRDE